jgi:7-cyano-7-deazaguanine reductase
MNNIENKVLGQQVKYPQHYQPDVLVAVPRLYNRMQYDIDEEKLPFVGVDTWHCYELSFLTKLGLPVQGLLKIVYPANSPCLIESKSLKLYLNSFNMEYVDFSVEESIASVKATVKNDLSKIVGSDVDVEYFRHGADNTNFDFVNYDVLEYGIEIDEIVFRDYNENHLLLETFGEMGEMRIVSHLLRSNCKITHQPDWGSVYLYIKGDDLPTRESLLRYIVSLRNENHFHEEICELIYLRIWERFKPKELCVSCLYTRRGGIDICPTRASKPELQPKGLIDAHELTRKLLRQ